MLDYLQYVKQAVLDRWGGSLNDLGETSYEDLMAVLTAKETDGTNSGPGGIQTGFDYFSKHSF